MPPAPPASAVSGGEGGEGDGGGRGEFVQRMGGAGQSDGLQPSEQMHNFQGAPAIQ